MGAQQARERQGGRRVLAGGEGGGVVLDCAHLSCAAPGAHYLPN